MKSDSTQWRSFARHTMEQLNSDFLEFIKLLGKNEVRYLIVGGYAVGFHGFPRYTGDIDFLVAISEENAVKLARVFDEFGFGGTGVGKGDFLQEDFVIEIGREPKKIQVLTGIDGVTFQECYEKKVEIDYSGTTIAFIGMDALIRNKLATGRAKDMIDVDELRRIHES